MRLRRNAGGGLCELVIKDETISEEDVVEVFSALPSRRLTVLDLKGRAGAGEFGGPSIDCLRGMEYFSRLRVLNVRRCEGVTSTMVQEILIECVHLISLDARYNFVRDIATASKGWGCFKLGRLVVRIAKQEGDEAGWGERMFGQVSRMRWMRGSRPGANVVYEEDDAIMVLKTLDYQLLTSPVSSETFGNNQDRGGDGGGSNSGGSDERFYDIRCLSSLVQLQEFTFDDGRQRLGMEEALWMMDHWQDMVVVRGTSKVPKGMVPLE